MEIPHSKEISQILFYTAMGIFGLGVIIQLLVTPTLTVTDVQFEERAEITEEKVTYYDELSPTEKAALKSENPDKSLTEYASKHGFQPTQNYGYVVSDSGLYTVYAKADYGVYQPIVKSTLPILGLVGTFVILRTLYDAYKHDSTTQEDPA